MKIEHLKKRSDFLAASKNGVSVAAKGLVLQALPNKNDSNSTRVGFTATKKLGNAVTRNRIKRRLRVIAMELIESSAKPGYDYVVIGRMAAIDRKFDELKKDFKYCLHATGSAK